MLKKPITYTDYNGVERTEDFYFNLSKAELMEMELGVTGGMTEMLNKIIAAKDAPSLMKTFKEMIITTYFSQKEKANVEDMYIYRSLQ